MRKIIVPVLILAMLLTSACAEVAMLSDALFTSAKTALYCLAAGDFDRLVTTLPFSDVSPSPDEWRNFARGSFTSLSGAAPQQQYAVAYWRGGCWKVAVPVTTPSSDGVETLILISEDGQTFSGYGCAAWGQIRREYQGAEYVRWQDEYFEGTSAVVEFDMK